MGIRGTSSRDLELLAPGARVVVRDQEWQVEDVERHLMGARAIVRCTGRSELVRGMRASFFSDLDVIEPEDPKATRLRLDTSPQGVETRLIIESLIRRTPLPVSNTKVMVGHRMLADDLPFQREPFRAASQQLQPRLLIADAVGLGKTIEVGIMLSELQRRGRANRVLAVVPRHILDQVQHELWCRFGFPLVRLDSEGIQRVRQKIPAGRNPFTYFNRVIISIDTLKNVSRYRHHLEKVRWDAVWIDESHKLVNRSTLNNHLAQVLAPNADALILTSATPHNGKKESFAELVSLLDPTAVPDPDAVTADDIKHLVVRRHKHSPDVAAIVGDRWAERAEPAPISITPKAEEEAVFRELSDIWLSPDRPAPCDDRLFPYTLLKAALSSPLALAETIGNRLRRDGRPDDEVDALKRLLGLAEEAVTAGSAKLDSLVATLKKIGVGRRSDTRAVIFSERIKTLEWLADEIRFRLDLDDDQVVTFHNSKNDEEQQSIVEDFAMASAPVRVLITSDIASEGVNLHKQCHHLIHFDLPWSLITLEQRNGRIDRYGQLHSPEIRYLIYSPADPTIASDIRVLSKLIAKENEAHKALGDAGSVMGLYSESEEEDAIIKVLRERNDADKNRALEEKAPTSHVFDPWAFAGLTSGTNGTTAVEPVPTDTPPTLFGDDADFLVQGLRLVYSDLSELSWEASGSVVSFRPPVDLLRRLEALPQSYLRQRNLADRIRLTVDTSTANQSLTDAVNAKASAGDTGTAWPEVHFLGPQHPVMDWLADKVLYRLNRNQAVAVPCNVDEPTVLVSGVWCNQLGEPIAETWLAATVEDGLVSFGDMFSALERAGVAANMVNPNWGGDLSKVEATFPAVVTAAISHLGNDMEDSLRGLQSRLQATEARLRQWQHEAREVAARSKSDTHRKRRLDDIDRITRQIEGLIQDHTPAGAPLIRIVGALLPRN